MQTTAVTHLGRHSSDLVVGHSQYLQFRQQADLRRYVIDLVERDEQLPEFGEASQIRKRRDLVSDEVERSETFPFGEEGGGKGGEVVVAAVEFVQVDEVAQFHRKRTQFVVVHLFC